MSSRKQRGEKVMVIGTDQFVEPNLELLNEAIKEYETGEPLFMSSCFDEWIDGNDWTMYIRLTNMEFFEIKFMFACFIMLAYGEEV